MDNRIDEMPVEALDGSEGVKSKKLSASDTVIAILVLALAFIGTVSIVSFLFDRLIVKTRASVSFSEMVDRSDYVLTSEMVLVILDLDLTAEGTEILYDAQPMFEGELFFTLYEELKGFPDDVITHGCTVRYGGGSMRIFVRDRLSEYGKRCVLTHEMLHAAWFRMSDDERLDLEGEILAFLEEEPLLESYAQLSGMHEIYSEEDLVAEWYAVLGTEVAVLSPELEEHYGRFLEDRLELFWG